MGRMISSGRNLAVAAVAVGVLSLGSAGVGGGPHNNPATAPTTTSAAHINCARATRALTRIDKIEARVNAGFPRLTRAEAKAKAAGHTKRATRIQKLITRLESAGVHTRLARRAAAIEAACHVSAPATTGSATSA